MTAAPTTPSLNVWTPAAPLSGSAEVEPQKAEALASAEVHDLTLFFVDFDLQLGQFLAQPFLHRRHQPVMSLVGVDVRILEPDALRAMFEG